MAIARDKKNFREYEVRQYPDGWGVACHIRYPRSPGPRATTVVGKDRYETQAEAEAVLEDKAERPGLEIVDKKATVEDI